MRVFCCTLKHDTIPSFHFQEKQFHIARKQTWLPVDGNNHQEGHFIFCPMLKYSVILGVFWQSCAGVFVPNILKEERALVTRLPMQLLFLFFFLRIYIKFLFFIFFLQIITNEFYKTNIIIEIFCVFRMYFIRLAIPVLSGTF